MADEPFDVGDVAEPFALFVGPDGAPADPATVTLQVRKPDGTVDTIATSNPEVGRYEGLVPLDQHGLWYYRFAGAGGVTAVEEGTIEVRRSRVLS